jgi:hypothetical protein
LPSTLAAFFLVVLPPPFIVSSGIQESSMRITLGVMKVNLLLVFVIVHGNRLRHYIPPLSPMCH